jgi:hypothetical protein
MKKKKTVPHGGTATAGSHQPVPPPKPATPKEKPATGNGFKQFLLLMLSVLLLLLFFKESYFDMPNYNRAWFDGRIMGYWEEYKEQKLNLDIEERKLARYDNYKFAKYVTGFFEQRGNADKVLLLVPPSEYFKANGIPIHVPEPAVFYYMTGLKTIWPNSREAIKANWVLSVKNGGLGFDSVINKQVLQDSIAAFNKFKTTL